MYRIADRVLKIHPMVDLAFSFSEGGSPPFCPSQLVWLRAEDPGDGSVRPLLTAPGHPAAHKGSLTAGLFGGLTSKTKIKMPFLFNSLTEHCCLLMFRR